MIPYPDIDPLAFSVFGWPVRWYGLMYLTAFISAFILGQRFLRRPTFTDLRAMSMDELLLAGMIGVIVGGRLGYVLFYQPAFYADDPLSAVFIWKGGMSFHGGLLGVIIAVSLYARNRKLPFLRLMDFAALLAPVGLGLGRVGNFINAELPGRAASSDLPWSMVFPGDVIARHPSSLYQAFLEGVVLFTVLQFFARRRRAPGFLSAVFLVGYGLARMFSELFREPDAHLGYLIGGLSMGQLLSLPMMLVGIALLYMDKWMPVGMRPAFIPPPPESAGSGADRESESKSKKDLNPVSASDAASTDDSDLREADVKTDAEADSDMRATATSEAEVQSQLESETELEESEESEESEIEEEDDEDEESEESETEEEDDEDEESETDVSERSASIPWWKKIFAGNSEEEFEEDTPRRVRPSRRETRRKKKKKRRN